MCEESFVLSVFSHHNCKSQLKRTMPLDQTKRRSWCKFPIQYNDYRVTFYHQSQTNRWWCVQRDLCLPHKLVCSSYRWQPDKSNEWSSGQIYYTFLDTWQNRDLIAHKSQVFCCHKTKAQAAVQQLLFRPWYNTGSSSGTSSLPESTNFWLGTNHIHGSRLCLYAIKCLVHSEVDNMRTQLRLACNCLRFS